MNDILIGVSTYNEIENLPVLVERIGQHLPAADLLVVDDNSPDGTGGWCQEQGARRTDFHYIGRSSKLGLGTATLATMQFATERGYKHLINMDADLSHPPAALPQLLTAMHDDAAEPGEQFDVAVGSRYVAGGRIVGWPLRRKLMSRCVNAFARFSLRLPCRDCSGSYRCYRVSKLREIDFQAVQSPGYSFFEEILWHLRHVNARFVEIPITFRDRRMGESKINLCEAINAVRILARLGMRSGPTK